MRYKSVCTETLIGKGSEKCTRSIQVFQGKLARKKYCLAIKEKLPATGPQGTAFGCTGVAEFIILSLCPAPGDRNGCITLKICQVLKCSQVSGAVVCAHTPRISPHGH